jgi:hypothetical protein
VLPGHAGVSGAAFVGLVVDLSVRIMAWLRDIVAVSMVMVGVVVNNTLDVFELTPVSNVTVYDDS